MTCSEHMPVRLKKDEFHENNTKRQQMVNMLTGQLQKKKRFMPQMLLISS